jgi:hypothetical protein
MAKGSTFCGVTGSGSVACRWDITGPPAVCAARLMQFALEKDVEVAIDQSVYDDPAAATRMWFSLIFDELPPLFQTFLKVLSIANRTGFFKLPGSIMWMVLNDLIANGVEHGVFQFCLTK